MDYGTSTVKRPRRTKAQIEELEQAIFSVVEIDQPMTIRGVFYRVMSLGHVAKTENGYRQVQERVLKMRRAGALPYQWITDGSRYRLHRTSYSGVEAALDAAARSYRRQLWQGMDSHVEVWSEKDAITGVVASVVDEYDVPLMVSRGFSSESFLYDTADALARDGRPVVIFQLGDHDPSGVKAWEDIQNKLPRFAPGIEMTFERIAVTPEQIQTFGLPTRPTKKSSHAKGFEGESVEVDAIPTGTLRGLVRSAIEEHMPRAQLDLQRTVEREERELLRRIAGQDWSAA